MRARNYKGNRCKKCDVEVSIGSKSGFCQSCCPKKEMTEETKEKCRLSKLGDKNPMFGKIAWNKGIPILESLREKVIESNKNREYTNEQKELRSLRMKGEKHWNWQGGITSISKRLRRSREYKQWRESVFERDDYTCQECGLKSGNGKAVILHPHHLKPFSLFPELRFNVDNGQTLCIECHKLTNTYGGKIIKDRIFNIQSGDFT